MGDKNPAESRMSFIEHVTILALVVVVAMLLVLYCMAMSKAKNVVTPLDNEVFAEMVLERGRDYDLMAAPHISDGEVIWTAMSEGSMEFTLWFARVRVQPGTAVYTVKYTPDALAGGFWEIMGCMVEYGLPPV